MADIHLRDTQYATTRRGLQFYKAFKEAVKKVIDKVDVLAVVGDIFDRSRPSPKVIRQLMEIDALLRAHGKPMIASTGNHDWCNPTWLSTLFPMAYEEDVTGKSGIIPLDEASTVFHGIKFTAVHPYAASAFRSKISEIEDQVKDADVVLYHNLVDGVVPFFAGKKALHVDEFPLSRAHKAWLLGDIHVQGYKELDRPNGGKTLVGYPGSLEMCSSAESTDKSVPIIKISKSKAEVQTKIDTEIQPYFSAKIRSEEDLDDFCGALEKQAKSHPVVVVDFSRSVPQTISRIHSLVDAQRAVVRCYPLPSEKIVKQREKTGEGEPELDLQYFITKPFDDRPDLAEVATKLLVQGKEGAEAIITELTDTRLAEASVRED